MFSGGDYGEVARWLGNFVTSHAKRENLRVEAVVETVGEDPISAGEAVIKIDPIFRKGKMTVSVSLHGEVFCS